MVENVIITKNNRLSRIGGDISSDQPALSSFGCSLAGRTGFGGAANSAAGCIRNGIATSKPEHRGRKKGSLPAEPLLQDQHRDGRDGRAEKPAKMCTENAWPARSRDTSCERIA